MALWQIHTVDAADVDEEIYSYFDWLKLITFVRIWCVIVPPLRTHNQRCVVCCISMYLFCFFMLFFLLQHDIATANAAVLVTFFSLLPISVLVCFGHVCYLLFAYIFDCVTFFLSCSCKSCIQMSQETILACFFCALWMIDRKKQFFCVFDTSAKRDFLYFYPSILMAMVRHTCSGRQGTHKDVWILRAENKNK